MENITRLLDAVKEKHGVETDYALAKTLALPRARICDYYKGNRAPDEYACLKIAEALGKPLDSIIATVKAKTEKGRQTPRSVGKLHEPVRRHRRFAFRGCCNNDNFYN